ncbi:class I SAM-dependent methyltransferase [Amycolatopsis sp. cmx-11-12]|uniref:class I SAM-dependent methyltransferase n=1 Tax=Amycolatopsis sp. cmx-11-12 TaxID=2785795 RepID=UPI0039184ADE
MTVPDSHFAEALAEIAPLLRCQSCFRGPLSIAPDGLACSSCAYEFPLVDGILDMSGAGPRLDDVGDKPYEGRWANFYDWLMSRPSRQRLDAGLLGLDVSRYYAEMPARLGALGEGPTLEVPCGNVPFLDYAEAYRRNGPWIFVDLSWELLRRLTARLAERGLRRHLAVRADVRSLPVVDGRMRNVVSMFGLHCFHDKATVFAEFRRCLRPEGAVVASTLTTDGHAISRFYHRLSQSDGTFASDNSTTDVCSAAQGHGFRIGDELRLGSAYVFGAGVAHDAG